ncbi:MAG: PepSY-associated TM helix domain-containing protein [Rubripirellula sp.]
MIHETEPEPTPTESPVKKRATRRRKSLNARTAVLVRWLHIYASMFGLAATLFFSVTGITLNHPDWFFGTSESVFSIDGHLGNELLTDLRDPESTTAQLAVAEKLRSAHKLSGAVHEFAIDEYQSVIAFAGPAYSADVFIDMETGVYELTEVRQGFTALINDLHKGRDSGPVWSLIIDVSAVLITLIAATGLLLILWLRRKRLKGLITAGVGVIALIAIYFAAVP